MRTAVCPKCHAKHLKWAQNALGMRYLVEFDSGVEHYLTCPGVPETDKSQPADGRNPEPSDSAESAGAAADGSAESESDTDAESDGDYDAESEREAQAESDTGAGAAADEPAEPEPDSAESEPEPSNDHKLQPVINRWVALRLNVMLVGPAGGGKTTAARKAAESIGVPYFERSVGPQTSQWDLVGFVGPTGAYNPGIAYEPFKNGGVLMLDEIDAGNPGIFVALNSMTANGHYTFPNGEQVEKSPDFCLIAGANTYGRGADRMYVGRQQLDAATLDRFAVLDWDYDERIEPIWAGGDDVAVRWTAYVQRVRAQAVALQMRFLVTPRASIFGARMLRAGIDRTEVEEAVLWKGLSRDERARFSGVAR